MLEHLFLAFIKLIKNLKYYFEILRSAKMHPIDQISIAALYSFSNKITSGALYHLVTTCPVNSFFNVFDANLFYLYNGGYFNDLVGIFDKEGVLNYGTSRFILNS